MTRKRDFKKDITVAPVIHRKKSGKGEGRGRRGKKGRGRKRRRR